MTAAFANALASIKATLSATFPQKEVLVTVDSTLNQLEALAVFLRRHRNQFAPVSKLPNEVLGMIFIELSLDLWECSLIESEAKYDLCTVTMCRIDLNEVPLASLGTRLARCKATDIHLHLTNRGSRYQWSLIRPHFQRIASITMVEDGVTFAEDVPWLPSGRVAGMDEDVPVLALKQFSLLSSFPANVFPRFFPSSLQLQTLQLQNADLDDDPNWDIGVRFPDLPSLKTLRICHADRRMGLSRFFKRGLLDVLSRVPLVEVVDFVWEGYWLKKGEERDPWHPETVGDTLLLQNLKKLSLYLYTPVVTSILRTIRSGAPLEKLVIQCSPYAFVAGGDNYEVARTEDFVEALTSMPIVSSTSLSMMSPPLLSTSFVLKPVMAEASEDLEESDFDPAGATTLRLHLYTTTALPTSNLSPSCLINLSLHTPIAHLAKADISSSVISTFSQQFQTVTHVELTGSFRGRRFWEALACLPCLSSLTFHCSISLNGFLSFFSQAHGMGHYFLLSCPALFPALKQISVGEGSLSNDSKDAIQRLMKIFDERHRTAVVAQVTIAFSSTGRVQTALGHHDLEDYHTGFQCE